VSGLYGTIWIALLLFCAGEAGRRREYTGRPPVAWAWWAFAAGAALCTIHVALAMRIVHGWDHAAAIAATARQTRAVYGLDWGGGLYANYAFVAVWALDAGLWRLRPSRGARDPGWLAWTARIFYLVMILNAAVIFTSGPRRIAGALMVASLVWIWRPGSRGRLESR
jgi:hypothetical protein